MKKLSERFSDENTKAQMQPYITTFKITFMYAMIGILWGIFSDRLIRRFMNNYEIYQHISIYNSIIFVLVTAAALYCGILGKILESDSALKLLKKSMIDQDIIKNQLNKLAYYDKLTGLPNLYSLEKDFKKIIKDVTSRFVMIKMDIDNFKNINDTMGSQEGDLFLVHFANVLKLNLEPDESIYRIGGDEFIILINHVSEDKAKERIEHIMNVSRLNWEAEAMVYYTSVSIGAVRYPSQGHELDILLRNSDIALNNVKRKTKNDFCFYSESLQKKTSNYITISNDLHRALENEEFFLQYQPIIDLHTNRLIGVEALIRWNHPEKGLISPFEFISIAEKTGIIDDIGRWVMKTAIHQKQQWEKDGIKNIKMSINVSGKSLIQEDFITEVRYLLLSTGVRNDEIQFEITETVLIEKLQKSKEVLEQVKKMGILVALDDFGTGYSSFSYLKNLPIDVIKLDSDFIKGILDGKEDGVILEALIQLTHNLKMHLVAEGIEKTDELNLLKLKNCDYGQGYLFSRPCNPEAIKCLYEKSYAVG